MSITAIGYLVIYFSGLIKSLAGRPIYGVLVYLFSFYMYAPGRWWGHEVPELRWAFIAAIITLLSILVWNQEKSNWLSRKEFKLYALYVAWVWLQNYWALNPAFHFEYTIMVTKFLVLIYIFSATIKTQKEVILFMLANTLGCAYFGWLGLTQHTGGRFETVGTPGLDDANLLTIHMAPILIASSYLLLCDFGKKKYMLVPFIVLILNAIFLTQSRGGLLAIAFSGFIALFFIPKQVKKQFLVFVLLALIGGISIVGSELTDRITQVTDAENVEETDKSAYSRLVIIDAQINMILERPWAGAGHWGTLILSPDYIDDTYLTNTNDRDEDEDMRRASHNLLMSLLVDQGLIGGGFFVLMVALFVKRFFGLRKYIINHGDDNKIVIFVGLNIALICIWVASMFANSLRLEVDLWFYFLISTLYSLIIKDESYIKYASEKHRVY